MEIKNLLIEVKSRIETHNKFKAEYDKQLAFDFSLFNFFTIGENKISQMLAYFLDEKQNHGQKNLFLDEFVKTFYSGNIDTTKSVNTCEKVITNNRRIDVHIELNNLTIAIENKVWADDQENQIIDYANFLEQKTNGNYLLLYLSPYGSEPTEKSLDVISKNALISDGKLKIISYKHDILNLINKWISICEAENVSHFLKEFKKFLEIKFLGKNTLNMSKEIRELIYGNQIAVQEIVTEYKNIENEIVDKLNSVGKELEKNTPEIDLQINLTKSGLFNWYGTRVYKYSLSNKSNKIWVQFVKNEINLISNYYLEDGTDTQFKDILDTLKINNHKVVNHKSGVAELVQIFLEQVKIVNESFRIYENLHSEK